MRQDGSFALAANLLSTAVHFVASPPEKQEDRTKLGKLLQQARC